MAIAGPSGSGKTYTGLIFATALADSGRVAVIDSERGSSAKYSDLFDFDVVDMREEYPTETFDPRNYVELIHTAEDAGYDVILIDSLTHEWDGLGGALELHDQATIRNKGNSWTAWREVTPLHQRLMDTILQSSCHVIATLRSKTEYVQTEDRKIKKLGMAPIQRPGTEYEFDLWTEMDKDEHALMVSKTRIRVVDDAKVVKCPTAAYLDPIKAWLAEGEAIPEKPEPNTSRRETPKSADAAPKEEEDWDYTAWWARANRLGVDKDTVHASFGVASMKDYTGTKAHAMKVLDIAALGVFKTLSVTDMQVALGCLPVDWQGTLDEAKAAMQLWIANEQGRTAHEQAQLEEGETEF